MSGYVGVKVSIPVSVGELYDKISILLIKSSYLDVHDELRQLSTLADTLEAGADDVRFAQLLRVNRQLWDAEDAIRAKDAKQEFDDEFIQLARSIYRSNDERAAIKRRINEETGSEIVEVKSYASY